MRRLLALLAPLLALAAACGGAAGTAQPPPGTGRHARPAGSPAIRHVVVVVLENEDADATFGTASPAPYLARTLTAQGAFIPRYYGIGHNSLDDYVATVSGQAPTPATQAGCHVFSDVAPGTPAADGQVRGDGCVYPARVQTIADQLEAHGLTWRAYMEDMGADPARDGGTACAHPPLGAPDGAHDATPQDQYATRHNPFVYFHSIIDDPARCAAHDVPLDRLGRDLAAAAATPNLAFVTPDLCHDGHDATCADGGPGGLAAADAFLREWVPRITGSPAFRRDGLLAIVFDEAHEDGSACCGERPGPNTDWPGGGPGRPGGGRTGAVLISPRIAPGTRTDQAYDHYSLLRSLEDAFGLPHLGYAAAPGLRPFGDDVFAAR